MAKKIQRGLGRGLEALMGDEPVIKAEERPVDEVKMLPIGDIDTNPEQPRRRFDEDALAELAQSIKSVGVLQPIIVAPSGSRYVIIAGERRFRASLMAEQATIPAIIRDFDLQKRLEATLIENLQRDDLNPIEEAEGVKNLMEQSGLTQEQVAERVGRSRPAVANLLRLLTLPESVRGMLEDGRLSAGHGRALLAADPSRREDLARLAVEQNWSVRQLERICAQPVKVERHAKPVRDGQLSQLETMARELFGTRARLDGDLETGKLTIYYYSAEDLQRIWDVVSGVE